MDAQELYERMKKVQEAKGYFFNKDKDRTFELLEALLVNKERYGYMGCPCRLLQPLCFNGLERGQNSPRICPRTTTAGKDAILVMNPTGGSTYSQV